MAKARRISIQLSKSGNVEFDSLLTENAQEMIRQKEIKAYSSSNFGESSKTYLFESKPIEPDWASDIKKTYSVSGIITSKSPACVVLFKKNSNIFSLAYGHGHAYLDNDKFEADFGLRVAINLVSDEKIRGLDRANLGTSIREAGQAAGHRNLSEFGVDDALELFRKINGESMDSELGRTISGARALKFTKEVEFSNIPSLCEKIIKAYKSKKYKNTAFAITDDFYPIIDTKQENFLNDRLIQSVKTGNGSFELGYPRHLPDEISYQKFENAGIRDAHTDITLELYRKKLGDQLEKIGVKELRHHKIGVFTAGSDQAFDRWSLYTAMMGTTDLNGEKFALNEGVWYKISSNITIQSTNYFNSFIVSGPGEFGPLIQKAEMVPGKIKGSGLESEGDYNTRMPKENNLICFDTKLVPVPGTTRGRIELCDLCDPINKRFIHIKKDSRSFSTLSHLFKQGANSASQFKWNTEFRKNIISQAKKFSTKDQLDALEKTILEDDWTVEFRIIDTPRNAGQFDIPFFSKVSFRASTMIIREWGMKMTIGFIKKPSHL